MKQLDNVNSWLILFKHIDKYSKRNKLINLFNKVKLNKLFNLLRKEK